MKMAKNIGMPLIMKQNIFIFVDEKWTVDDLVCLIKNF